MKKICISIILVILTSMMSFADYTTPYRTGIIEGYVKDVADNQIKIEEYDGSVHLLPLSNKAVCTIDQIPVTLKDFKAGMEVFGEIKGRSVTLLESYSTQNPGYIPPGGKVRSGIVKKIDRDQLIIKTLMGDETYFTSPATITLKKATDTQLSSLYEGDRVKLYFDEINSDVISRLNIEGNSILIKDLYRAVVKKADNLEDKIVFDKVEVFKNGKWDEINRSITLPYSSELPLYIGGQKVPYENLKYYRGKTAYLAMKDFFGTEKIEKMVLKNQYERSYSDKIEKINWYADQFELKNKKNISFTEGTMIIKNGRLVDKDAITPNADAFVVADGRGTNQIAGVISIYNEDLNNSNIGQNYLYVGRMNRIFEDAVYLKDFYLLNNHEWESYRTRRESDEKELYYDQDTMIYDLENQNYVSAKEFFAKDYAVDEDTDSAEDKNLRDWYAYAYTDGDRIAGIMVQKHLDSLNRHRMTTGSIEKIEDDPQVGWTVSLRDSKDYSHRHDKWMIKNSTIRVNLRKAMIIKDGKIIEPEMLKTSDRLYVVRDDFTAKVVIVK
ncbi:hypothetical protein [Anaerophilus nitritogenes]|uniref:hypothetical protein n=1 Tax=Anaerophilus nitritogenes TaxID=2498136 RepID=UPI00101C9728|nr:hypothetical protein [Anaerophilus nitritogenes]